MATIKVDQLVIDDTLLIRKEREEFTKNLTKEMETFSTHSSCEVFKLWMSPMESGLMLWS